MATNQTWIWNVLVYLDNAPLYNVRNPSYGIDDDIHNAQLWRTDKLYEANHRAFRFPNLSE